MSVFDEDQLVHLDEESRRRHLAAKPFAEAAETAMGVARVNPTRETIKAARAALQAIPSSVGFEVDAWAGDEELDELEANLRR
jgi:hypothetical protein